MLSFFLSPLSVLVLSAPDRELGFFILRVLRNRSLLVPSPAVLEVVGIVVLREDYPVLTNLTKSCFSL